MGASGSIGSVAGSGNQPVVSVPSPVTPGGGVVGSAPGTSSTWSCHTGPGLGAGTGEGSSAARAKSPVRASGVVGAPTSSRVRAITVAASPRPHPRPVSACIWLPATLQPAPCHTGASTITAISSPTRTVVAVTSTARSGVTPYVRFFARRRHHSQPEATAATSSHHQTSRR